jgi:hypothetical protein
MVRPRVEPAYPAGLVRHGGLAVCLVVGRSGSLVLVAADVSLNIKPAARRPRPQQQRRHSATPIV